MPTHFQLSWVRAVKEWNEHQPFHNDIYAIPKKGGDSYGEVVSLREAFKRHHNGPTQKEEPKPKPVPEPETKVAENVPEEDLNVAFDKDLTVDFSKFTTLEDKVKKIREVFFAGHFTRADKKAALSIALDILKYKENHIIQEARNPIQKEIVIMLNDIRKTPIFKKYNIVGHNPASGIPDYRIIDNSDLVNDIPTINADLLKEIEKDQKANEKARKKADKEKEKRDMIEEQERKERDKKLNAPVDVEAVKKRWGKYPDALIAYLHKNKIRDSLDFERKISKLPSDVPRRPQAVWKNFFVDLGESA
jgi:hypothetical protein